MTSNGNPNHTPTGQPGLDPMDQGSPMPPTTSGNGNPNNIPMGQPRQLVPPPAYPMDIVPAADREIIRQLEAAYARQQAKGAEEDARVGTPDQEAAQAAVDLELSPSEAQDVLGSPARSQTSGRSKTNASAEVIAAAWLGVFRYLDDAARQSLLEGTGFTIQSLSGLSLEAKQMLATAPLQEVATGPPSNTGSEMDLRGGAGSPEPTGMSSPIKNLSLGTPAQAQGSAAGPSNASSAAGPSTASGAAPNDPFTSSSAAPPTGAFTFNVPGPAAGPAAASGAVPTTTTQPSQLFLNQAAPATTVFQKLTTIPREILLELRRHLPPIDELILSQTHPGIFENANFSFYRLDAQYQRLWQNGYARFTEQRLPLLEYAICNGAPLDVVKANLDVWAQEGLDYNLNWTVGTARTRDPELIAPIFLAASHCRADVVEELRRRGANEDGLEKYIFMGPFSCPWRHFFSDQRWFNMEQLALEMYAMDIPAVATEQWLRWTEAATMAGWLELLKLLLAPIVRSIAGLQSLPHLDNLIRRQTRSAMSVVYVPAGAYKGEEPYDDWLSLLILGGRERVHRDSLSGGYYTPRRHRNAALIMTEIMLQGQFHWFSLRRTMVRYIQETAADDDSLDLTSSLHNGLMHLINRNDDKYLTSPGIDNKDYALNRHPQILRSYMLFIALYSAKGAPRTVRWLAVTASVNQYLPMYELKFPHAIENLYRAPSIPVLQQNIDSLLQANQFDPNGVLPDKRPLRPIDLIHEDAAVAVEFVARGRVDVTLAGMPTKLAAHGRRALRQHVVTFKAGDVDLYQTLARPDWTYADRRRILDWCLVNNTNDIRNKVLTGIAGI
ncbi:hypothetical protein PG984_015003 [Apiospora sp. TS-2023a]